MIYKGTVKVPDKAYEKREHVFRIFLVKRLTDMNSKIIDEALDEFNKRNGRT